MAEPTIQLGGGNWAGKTDNLLGYYKEGERFYKQDFTFSRSTTGTYTDSDGYIQEMPYNKLTYSEDFSNAAWLKTSGVTVTSNYGISPDGKQNSTRLQFATNNEQIYDGIVHSGNTETASIYVKGQSGITMQFGVGANISQGGTYTLTGEWQRLEHQSTSGSLFIIGNKDLTATDIEIWGAQLVKGTSAKTYFPTTTRLNMPRVDYLNNSNGSLILEPQRTNLITYSEDFTNSGWDDSWYPVSITSNSIISPDGSLNATLITPTSGNSKHAIRNLSASAVSGNTYTLSVFVKKGASRYVVFGDAGDALWRVVTADLDNGVITNEYNSIGTITDYENGWYRITCQITRSNSGTIQFSLGASETNSNSALPDFDDTSLTIYAFGAQIEQGSYATTLINTSGSSVTRNADACELTNVADRINSTEGTMYVEFNISTGDGIGGIVEILNPTSGTNRVLLWDSSSTDVVNLQAYFGTKSSSITSSDVGVGNFKAAITYSNSVTKFFLNGVKIGEQTSNNPYTGISKVDFQNSQGGVNFQQKRIKDFKLYNTALSDSELATLTTL